VSGVHLESDDRTSRADGTRLSPLPLPGLRLRQRDAWMLDWQLMSAWSSHPLPPLPAFQPERCPSNIMLPTVTGSPVPSTM
jgi:hypothetical protein